MRIEFQYTLGEWLELKRANLGFIQLPLLRIAEVLLKPLFFVCALSLIVSVLQYLKIALVFTGAVPGWMPLVFLVLLAVANISLSLMPKMRKHILKKGWEVWITKPNYRLEITEEGIGYNSTDASCMTAWNKYRSAFQTKRLLMFNEDEEPDVLVIPKRAFGNKKQLEEFLELAYRKMVTEREPAEKLKPV